MDQLQRTVLDRKDPTGVRMAAGAVRNRYISSPETVLSALANWTEHSEPWVRIAAGVSFASLTVRNPDSLATVMPYVERLANDRDAFVRSEGAAGALEIVWLHHYDSIWIAMEDWIDRKNDLVRRVVIEAMGRIVAQDLIGRPSTLRDFIERGVAIIDRLVVSAAPDLRPALAATVNEFGQKGPDLLSPWVREWSARSDFNSISLVKEVLEMPFGDRCRGIDRGRILARMAEIESEMVRRISNWLRRGSGRMQYLTIIADGILNRVVRPGMRESHWADPYRGCQFRCEFCGTRDLAEFSGDCEEEFVRRITAVTNAAEALDRDLHSEEFRSVPNPLIRIGMDSDPYQVAEDKFQVTREMLKVLLARETPVVVQTRSSLVLRDLDLLAKLAERGLVEVLISLPTSIEAIRKRLEPGVPNVADRMRTIGMLARKGVPTGLVVSPVVPHLTDQEESLDELVRRSVEAGATSVTGEVLNMRGTAGARMRCFLETFIPALLPRFEELYGRGRDARAANPEYSANILERLLPALAAKYGATREPVQTGSGAR